MAITVVGTAEAQAINGADVTLDLTTIAGLAEGDVVVAFGSFPLRGSGEATLVSSGWTSRGAVVENTDVAANSWFKRMGSSPDTSLVVNGTGNTSDGGCVVGIALRGVDLITPQDATPTTTGALAASTNPDPPSITTVSDGAYVISFMGTAVSDTSVTAPSGYGDQADINSVDSQDMTAGVAGLIKASAGAEDPATWTNTSSARWIAQTWAMRPAGPITMVGTPTEVSSANGGNVQLAMPTGLAENDVVYVALGLSSAAGGDITATNWVNIASQDNTVRLSIWRKIMGASPDSSLLLIGTGNAADSTTGIAFAFRGVDTTTPEDATPTTATGSSTNPDPPSITPATTGAVILPFACSRISDTSIVAPAGYSNQTDINRSDDTNDVTTGGATKTGIAGVAENPAAWTGWSSAVWATITVAVRPAVAGGAVEDGVLSAAGTGAFSATGKKTHAGALSAPGVGAFSGVGRSRAAAVLSAAGTGALGNTGLALAIGVLQAAAAGTFSGIAKSEAVALLAAAGTGTFAGAMRTTSAAALAAAAAGAFSGTGRTNAKAVFAAAGIGAFEATGEEEGQTVEDGVLSAPGTGAFAGVGKSTAAAVLSASGTGAIAATGGVTAAAILAASGIGGFAAISEIVSPVAPTAETFTGGWSPRQPPSRRERDDERRRLGILPPEEQPQPVNVEARAEIETGIVEIPRVGRVAIRPPTPTDAKELERHELAEARRLKRQARRRRQEEERAAALLLATLLN